MDIVDFKLKFTTNYQEELHNPRKLLEMISSRRISSSFEQESHPSINEINPHQVTTHDQLPIKEIEDQMVEDEGEGETSPYSISCAEGLQFASNQGAGEEIESEDEEEPEYYVNRMSACQGSESFNLNLQPCQLNSEERTEGNSNQRRFIMMQHCSEMDFSAMDDQQYFYEESREPESPEQSPVQNNQQIGFISETPNAIENSSPDTLVYHRHYQASIELFIGAGEDQGDEITSIIIIPDEL
ncbi:hypothetical protein FGO68_gene16128 [Halteria grandinella]|uniref:Uncharacterized protein n=1 Tax=Halteria grandinella TaxID=5974 RepID=A0A8J8NJV6_HALGN|nr:hypothetical protein FGO68_gene16128 [Halteria grandinella]